MRHSQSPEIHGTITIADDSVKQVKTNWTGPNKTRSETPQQAFIQERSYWTYKVRDDKAWSNYKGLS